MKNLIAFLAVSLIILTHSPVKAEGDTKLGGVRAGWQYSTMTFNGTVSAYPLSSFYLGVFKNNKLAPSVHWTIGLEYFQNGYKEDDNNKWVLGYLSLPVNAKLKLGPFFALGGLSANVKLSEDVKNGNPLVSYSASAFDLPLHVGIGFRIAVINLEARYHWGMLEIDSGVKNQYLQLGAGVSF